MQPAGGPGGPEAAVAVAQAAAAVRSCQPGAAGPGSSFLLGRDLCIRLGSHPQRNWSLQCASTNPSLAPRCVPATPAGWRASEGAQSPSSPYPLPAVLTPGLAGQGSMSVYIRGREEPGHGLLSSLGSPGLAGIHICTLVPTCVCLVTGVLPRLFTPVTSLELGCGAW